MNEEDWKIHSSGSPAFAERMAVSHPFAFGTSQEPIVDVIEFAGDCHFT